MLPSYAIPAIQHSNSEQYRIAHQIRQALHKGDIRLLRDMQLPMLDYIKHIALNTTDPLPWSLAGQVCYACGNMPQALALLSLAYECNTRILGANDVLTLYSIHNVCLVMIALGNGAQSLVFLKSTSDSLVQYLGLQGEALTCIATSALAFLSAGHTTEAWQTSLFAFEQAHTMPDNTVSATRLQVVHATILMQTNRWHESLNHLSEAYHSQSQNLHRGHVDTMLTTCLYIAVQCHMQHYQTALHLLLDCMQIAGMSAEHIAEATQLTQAAPGELRCGIQAGLRSLTTYLPHTHPVRLCITLAFF